MKVVSLNEGWRLLEAPLSWGRDALARVLVRGEGWMDCALPCDVRMPLEACGRIRDVAVADYSYESEWIEKRSWWFAREIEAKACDLEAEVAELVLESLDARADVFLNGNWLGEHRSAHHPFVADVREALLPGKNALVVRVTTGLEAVSGEDLAEIHWAVSTEAGNGRPDRGDLRRAFVRKPQYAVGWDWGPRVVTCGIVRGAALRFGRGAVIRGAHARTVEVRGSSARLRLTLEIDQLHPFQTRDGDVRVTLTPMWAGANCAQQVCELPDVLLTSGLNSVDMEMEIAGARLWWPAGYGEQPLYELRASVCVGGQADEYPPFCVGLRTVALDLSRVDALRRNFALVVNGVRIFCKGGNWIPADSVYARVTDEKYCHLVAEAREAGFTMLRVWGGGVYERDVFYEACDRAGILLWHDFMFACAAYPDHLEWFRREVERECEAQTRRLRNHACLALLCGNNENHWLMTEPGRGLDIRYQKQYGLFTGNAIARAAVLRNCPEIPYWNSSPYGGAHPNGDEVGDVHHWGACMMNAEMEKRIEPREYDKVHARFVSEYGYPGPCPIESIRQYLGTGEIDREGALWKLHTNTFEKSTVAAGILKHYGLDAARLSTEEYVLYAGLVQSLMLEYSLEALRFLDFCAGALFWMYNDTWGEVGWTIVDYYLRRKIAYYGVKRAFAPVKLTLRLCEGKAKLQGANDTERDVRLRARVGYMKLDGSGAPETRTRELLLAARSRAYLSEYELPEADYERGVFAVLPDDPAVAPAVLRMRDTRQMHLPEAAVRVLACERSGDGLDIMLTADAFLHAVHVKEGFSMSDNYFDLLPGQVKRVHIAGASECPVWHAVRARSTSG